MNAAVLAAAAVVALALRHGPDATVDGVTVPPGFTVGLFAEDVPNARSLALGDRGTVFVGTKQRGAVYALVDADGNGHADRLHTLAAGLWMPNGVAFHDGALYVAEVNRILRFDAIEQRLENPSPPATIRDDLPGDPGHGWRHLRVGPDNKLYLGIGVPCNVCEPGDEQFATLLRMNLDGTEEEIVARGVRNSVGFDWHPTTGELWFTDNGRDQLGDDQPPDELNRVGAPGAHFGFPYCHGWSTKDPVFGAGRSCTDFAPPVAELGPHVAALGLRFYAGAQFPDRYRGNAFIAEHGSWNRTDPIGYRVTVVRIGAEQGVSYDVFASGWLRGSHAWGRPVDLLVMADGSLLVSDDLGGRIYRIRYLAGLVR